MADQDKLLVSAARIKEIELALAKAEAAIKAALAANERIITLTSHV